MSSRFLTLNSICCNFPYCNNTTITGLCRNFLFVISLLKFFRPIFSLLNEFDLLKRPKLMNIIDICLAIWCVLSTTLVYMLLPENILCRYILWALKVVYKFIFLLINNLFQHLLIFISALAYCLHRFFNNSVVFSYILDWSYVLTTFWKVEWTLCLAYLSSLPLEILRLLRYNLLFVIWIQINFMNFFYFLWWLLLLCFCCIALKY